MGGGCTSITFYIVHAHSNLSIRYIIPGARDVSGLKCKPRGRKAPEGQVL